MKKFMITGLLAVAFVLSGGPAPVEAQTQTNAELQAMIDALMDQLNGVTTTTSGSMLSAYDGVNLRVGSTGTRVSELQSCMNYAGFSTGAVDGVFGSKTAAGVMAFQAANGLVVDGIVGVATTPAFQAACTMGDVEEEEEEEEETEFDSSNGEEADVESLEIDKGDDDEPSNNSEQQEAFEVTVELDEDGGDAQIERMDLKFAITPQTGGEDDTYDIIEKITIMVDGDEVASMDSNDDDDWRGDDEDTLRISGIDTIVEAGEEVVFVIALDIADLDEDDDLDLDIELEEVEIRYTDEAGITDTVTEDDGEKVTVEAKDEFELNIDENNDNPEDDETLNLSEDIDGQVLFIADVEVDEDGQDGTLEEATVDVKVTLKENATEDLDTDELIDELSFMMDGDEIDSDDASGEITTGSNTVTVTFTFDLDDIDVEREDEFEVSVEADFKELDEDSEFIGATIETENLVFDGEDEEGDNLDTSETDDPLNFTSVYTASAGALVLEESDVDGYNEIGDDAASAKAVFEFELTADGDEDVTLDELTLDLNGSEVDFAATAWEDSIISGIYTIRVEIKDGSDWEYVDDAGDDDVDNVIEDGDTEMFRVTVIVNPTVTDRYELELGDIDYTDALSVSGTLDMNLEAEEIDLIG